MVRSYHTLLAFEKLCVGVGRAESEKECRTREYSGTSHLYLKLSHCER